MRNKSDAMELKSRQILANTIDKKYLSLKHNGKSDNYDFTNEELDLALEITQIIPINEVNAYEYQLAKNLGKKPDKSRVIDGDFDSNDDLILYYGSDMDEINSRIVKSILIKEKKLIKRKGFKHYELCIYVEESGLFDDLRSFNGIFNRQLLENIHFEIIYIITCDYVFKITKDSFSRFEKII